jgi:hypothetical protein
MDTAGIIGLILGGAANDRQGSSVRQKRWPTLADDFEDSFHVNRQGSPA